MTASTEWRAAPAGFTEEDRAALAETLGVSLDDHIGTVLSALQAIAPTFGL